MHILENEHKNRSTVEVFLSSLRGNGRSADTVKSYGAALSVFQKWVNAKGLLIPEMTLDNFDAYKVHLEDRKLKGGTKAIYVTAVRSMWKRMHERGLVPYSETKIQIPAHQSEHHAMLTREEYERLIKVFSEFHPQDVRDKAIFMCLWDTGARIAELLNVDMGKVDLRKGTIVLKTYKRKDHHRVVCLTENTISAVLKWLQIRQMVLDRYGLESVSPLFINMNTRACGERLGKYAVQGACRRAHELAGIEKDVTPHTFRHGCGTDLMINGMDIRFVQEYLGHARLSTTQIYTHVTESQVHEKFRAIRGGLTPLTKNGKREWYVPSEEGTEREDARLLEDGPFVFRSQQAVQTGSERRVPNHP